MVYRLVELFERIVPPIPRGFGSTNSLDFRQCNLRFLFNRSVCRAGPGSARVEQELRMFLVSVTDGG
jgi:hypothetical protein